MGFVHLHAHTEYSLLDGTASPAQLAKAAKTKGMDAVAITDTANMFGAVQFYKACKKEGIRPVLGSLLYVEPGGISETPEYGRERSFEVIALIENDAGYQSLCALLTKGIFDGLHYKPRVDLSMLREHHEGLIVLTGGLKGLVGRAVDRGDMEAMNGHLSSLKDIFGPKHLFLELSDLGVGGEDEINEVARQAAAEHGLSLVVTNAAHYLEPYDAATHEVMHCIHSASSLKDTSRSVSPTDQAYLKTEEEMQALFPNDQEALERTVEIAERCNYAFDMDNHHFPATTPPDGTGSPKDRTDTESNWAYFRDAFPPPSDFPIPESGYPDAAGSLSGYFEWYCREGLERRLESIQPADPEAYRTRLERELKIVIDMGFPAYLLIVAEFINWAKERDIPVGPGRGSAAGSLACFAMRITDIDPLRFGLLFERFLNPARVSMPDIDVDFCQDRREEVIEHVRRKYGTEYVSQIITYGRLKAKAALRDVVKVLNLSFKDGSDISGLIPDQLNISLDEALKQEKRLRARYDGDPKARRVLDVARAVEGKVRNTGIHAAGVVIADRPLHEYAPLYRDGPDSGAVVQYDMKSAESIGLIKFDFLGLKTLDQIRDAIDNIKAARGEEVDLSSISWDDPTTYDMLSRGDALGVFQLESSGMRSLLKRLRPSSMDDMVALVALYRPGPLSSGMTDSYVECKHGRKEVEYPHACLEPILAETYGTIVYQEQVMQTAQRMAKYSLGEADLLRRAMGKKDEAEMRRQRERFLAGAEAEGFAGRTANKIFDDLSKFAAYGFNKSHSAAYGMIAYQTAWLKANYPAEYMAALMTIAAHNTDKLLDYIRDCQAHNIDVLPPCLNESERAFRPLPPSDTRKRPAIRFGLCAVKNVGDGAVQSLLDARKSCGGSFVSPLEVFEQADQARVNKRVMENLIKAGAFDFSGVGRGAMLEVVGRLMSVGSRRAADRAAGQGSLFGATPQSRVDFEYPQTRNTLFETLALEHDALGFYLSGHPMDVYTADVERYAVGPIACAEELPATKDAVRFVGRIGALREQTTRNKDRMAFVELEDSTSRITCLFFAAAFARSKRSLVEGDVVLVTGTVQNDRDKIVLRANTCESIAAVRERSIREVILHLKTDELAGGRLAKLLEVLEDSRGGCKARMRLVTDTKVALLSLDHYRVSPMPMLEQRIQALFGRADVLEFR